MPSMTPGIEYALGAMLFFGLGDLVYKRGAAAGAQPHHFLMVQSWVFTPTVALYGWATGSLEFSAAAIWLLLGAPAPGDAAGRRESRSSLVRVLIATATVGVGNFVYKLGLQAGANPASMITAQGIVVITLATVFVGVVDRRIRPSVAALRYAPRAAVVLAFAFAFMVGGMARAQASVVVPIAQMGFVVTALLGFLFLREPFTARKGAGLAAALAALASLAYG